MIYQNAEIDELTVYRSSGIRVMLSKKGSLSTRQAIRRPKRLLTL